MQNLFGKTVLITGGSGFIGTHLADRLTRCACKIYALSRKAEMKGQGVHWIQADVAEIEQLREVFAVVKPDIVFHLASLVTGRRDLSQIEPTFRNNLLTTVNILTLVTEHKCDRLILVGSMEEPESGSLEVAGSPYSAAKWAGSEYARMFFNLYGTPVVNATLYMVYGPNQKDGTKLIPYVTNSLLSSEVPKLSSGRRLVDWIYVDDVVDGLILLAETPGVEGKRIDLGSGVTYSIRTVVETLMGLIQAEVEPDFDALPDRPLERTRVADIGSAFKLLGWRPKIGIHEGLAKTVDWYRGSNRHAGMRDTTEKIDRVQPL